MDYVRVRMKRPAFGSPGLVVLTSAFLTIASFCGTSHAGDARVHDGLYLRLGAGLGYGIDSIKSDQVSPLAATIEGTATGFAGATELEAGGSLADGFVLGGGLYSAWIFSPKASGATLSVGGVSVSSDVDFDASSFHVLGPFAAYYFDPTAGLHVQAGLGYAWLSAGDAHYRTTIVVPIDVAMQSTGGSGFGLMFGVGDEWWVSDSFSIGVLGRLTMGFMSGENNGVTWHHDAFAPAVLFVATMN